MQFLGNNSRRGAKFMEVDQNGYHLILGELKDLVTGEMIPDTHDERSRQQLAQQLMGPCGFTRNEIRKGVKLDISSVGKKASLQVDFLVSFKGKVCFLIKYAPGSLVTRWKSAIALSRVIVPYQIPMAVVTNGKDADILDGKSGSLIRSGFDALPGKDEFEKKFDDFDFTPVSDKKRKMGFGILYAFEVSGSCAL